MVFFFFQAEDGIRDGHVTGVQTCALPISRRVPGSVWLNLGDSYITNAPGPRTNPGTLRGPSNARTKIGRASCRERVSISVLDVILNQKEIVLEEHEVN